MIMKHFPQKMVWLVLAITTSLLASMVSLAGDEHGDSHGEEQADEQVHKGPHNGRLLQHGDFTLELAIYEKDVPPEYRAWASKAGKPLLPEAWQLQVELKRLGGKTDRFTFTPEQDFLRGQGVVEEPHSFDVMVTASHGQQQYRWAFDSYEGRLVIAKALAEQSGITMATAEAGNIHQTITLYGQAMIDPARVRHIKARYPGVIQSVKAVIGQKVRAGELLATIEANDSLRSYNVVSPINGTVVARMANAGEMADGESLFTLVDSSRLRVAFPVFPRDAGRIQPGQEVSIAADTKTATSRIDTLIPAMQDAPTLTAHAWLDNASGQWITGTWVEGRVTVAQTPVALRVDNRALQSFRDWQVVFIQVSDTYEIRPLELGASDGQFTEVLGGLNAGDRYVVENSYLLKADLEKSGASHDH